jgi:hypothetical protein
MTRARPRKGKAAGSGSVPRVLERRFSMLVGVVVQRAELRGALAHPLCLHTSVVIGLAHDGFLMLLAHGCLDTLEPRLETHPWDQLLLVTEREVGLTRRVLDAALWALYAAHVGAWRLTQLPEGYEPDPHARDEASEVVDTVAFFHMQVGAARR